MLVKEVKTKFNGHHIAVRNAARIAFSLPFMKTEAKLYIDGKVVDTNDELFSRGKAAVLRGGFQANGHNHVVEIYARSSLFRTPIKICVDGKRVSGNRFYWFLF